MTISELTMSRNAILSLAKQSLSNKKFLNLLDSDICTTDSDNISEIDENEPLS